MSANNQMVITYEDDGYTVWHDGCVDNPFPLSASVVQSGIRDLDTAVKLAQAWGYTEYGLHVMDGPAPSIEEAELELSNEEKVNLARLAEAIEKGACKHCSTEYSICYHSDKCERDPDELYYQLLSKLQSEFGRSPIIWQTVVTKVLEVIEPGVRYN